MRNRSMVALPAAFIISSVYISIFLREQKQMSFNPFPIHSYTPN